MSVAHPMQIHNYDTQKYNETTFSFLSNRIVPL